MELFKKSSIVVLPYIEASQSGVIPLAYDCKKPVITTNVGSLSEVVKNNVTGILVPPKNIEKLGNAIVTLLNDPKKRKAIGNAAYQFSKKHMSWDEISMLTLGYYKKVLDKK